MREPCNPTIPLPHGGHLAADFVRADGDFAVVWVHGFGSHRGGDLVEPGRVSARRFERYAGR